MMFSTQIDHPSSRWKPGLHVSETKKYSKKQWVTAASKCSVKSVNSRTKFVWEPKVRVRIGPGWNPSTCFSVFSWKKSWSRLDVTYKFDLKAPFVTESTIRNAKSPKFSCVHNKYFTFMLSHLSSTSNVPFKELLRF